MEQHDRMVALLRDYAKVIDVLRRERREDLTKEPAMDETERFLADPSLNRAMMEPRLNRLREEWWRLTHLPAASTYDEYQPPALDDDSPFDF